MVMPKGRQSDIFSMFHDGELNHLQWQGADLAFQVEISYLAQLIDPAYTCFRGIFHQCRKCEFYFWGDEKMYGALDGVNAFLKDMEVAEAREESDGICIVCVGGHRNAGGLLFLDCDDVFLFDEGGKAIISEQLAGLCRRYWDTFRKKTWSSMRDGRVSDECSLEQG